MNRSPNDFVVYGEIFVNQPISHSDHPTPRYLRRHHADIVGNMARSLAYDSNLTSYRLHGFQVLKIICKL